MEDSRIIALFFERSELALSALESRYGAAIRNTAAHMLQDRQDVEECINDVYFSVWNAIPPNKPDHLVSYVCRITKNLAMNRLRAKAAKKRFRDYDLVLDELAECIPSGTEPDSELEAKELGRAIDHFLDGLSNEDRTLFVRRYWYGAELSELAALSGKRENAISVRLFRLREKLKKALMKEGYLT